MTKKTREKRIFTLKCRRTIWNDVLTIRKRRLRSNVLRRNRINRKLDTRIVIERINYKITIPTR